jgi:hypothetical protein
MKLAITSALFNDSAYLLLFIAFTKILVGVGQTENGTTDKIEIIDLKDPDFRCQNFPPLPGVSSIQLFLFVSYCKQTKLGCVS